MPGDRVSAVSQWPHLLLRRQLEVRRHPLNVSLRVRRETTKMIRNKHVSEVRTRWIDPHSKVVPSTIRHMLRELKHCDSSNRQRTTPEPLDVPIGK